jgi:magnesium-transporting ATPase (P-type)
MPTAVGFDPVNKRTEATIKDPSGAVFRVSKGAPQVVLALTKLVGAELVKAQQAVNNLASHGYRTIGVAVAHDDAHWTFLGILPLLDPPRPEASTSPMNQLETNSHQHLYFAPLGSSSRIKSIGAAIATELPLRHGSSV